MCYNRYMEEVKACGHELYTTTRITHTELAKYLSEKFGRPIDRETTKQWAKQEGWTEQRMKYLATFAGDKDRIQIMKDIVYEAMLDNPAPMEMQKLTGSYASLMKIVISPDRGGEKRVDELL